MISLLSLSSTKKGNNEIQPYLKAENVFPVVISLKKIIPLDAFFLLFVTIFMFPFRILIYQP